MHGSFLVSISAANLSHVQRLNLQMWRADSFNLTKHDPRPTKTISRALE